MVSGGGKGEGKNGQRGAAGKGRTGLWGRGSLAPDGASWRWVGSYHLVLFWPRKGSCGRLRNWRLVQAAEEEKSAKPKEGGGAAALLEKKDGFRFRFFVFFLMLSKLPPY
jgi:hypothetical protein